MHVVPVEAGTGGADEGSVTEFWQSSVTARHGKISIPDPAGQELTGMGNWPGKDPARGIGVWGFLGCFSALCRLLRVGCSRCRVLYVPGAGFRGRSIGFDLYWGPVAAGHQPFRVLPDMTRTDLPTPCPR